VNVNTGTQWFMEAFLTSAVNDLVYQKIGSLRMLTMKECCGNPSLTTLTWVRIWDFKRILKNYYRLHYL